MATHTSKQITPWTDIPEEIQDMIMCHGCSGHAIGFAKEVVLSCAHIMCTMCLKDRREMARRDERESVDCPKCATISSVPKGGLLGFSVDSFSLILRNSLLNPGADIRNIQPGPLPSCGVHPQQHLSSYCQKCNMQVCKLCLRGSHASHNTESLADVAEKLDSELCTYIKPTLIKMISDTTTLLDITRAGEASLKSHKPIKETSDYLNKLSQQAGNTIIGFDAEEQALIKIFDETLSHLEQQKHFLQNNPLFSNNELSAEVKSAHQNTVSNTFTLMEKLTEDKERQLVTIREKGAAQHRMANKVKSSGPTFDHCLTELRTIFEHTLTQLREQRESLEQDYRFAELLHQKGNNSDKMSRIPGMRKMISNGKQLSGKQLEFEARIWKFQADTSRPNNDVNIKLSETMVNSTKGESGDFRSLYHKHTVTISCEKPCYTRSVTLFNQQHIIHVFPVGTRCNEICVHNSASTVPKIISVPDIKQCISPVVIDNAGVMVVADHVQFWDNDMRKCQSPHHIRGVLHWLNLNERYNVTKHEQILMQCAQRGSMKVSHTGHLLVLNHCTTGEHHKQLVEYGSNRGVLRCIPLSDIFIEPISALNSGSNIFVVTDWGRRQVIWIDQHGEVLQQYGGSKEELDNPFHIYQHSNGSLLIADRKNHRVQLVSNEGKLLRCLLQSPDIRFPRSIYFDEQTGLLCILQGENIINVELKTFQVLPCNARINQICLSVQR